MELDKNNISKELVTASDAIRILGIGRATFYTDHVQSLLPKPIKMGKRVFYLKSELRGVTIERKPHQRGSA